MLWVFFILIVVFILLCCIAVLVHMVCRLSREVADLKENTIAAFRVVTRKKAAGK